MRKIVLDQFSKAWGYAEVPEKVKTIKVFTDMAGNTPINVRERKVSANQKYEKQLKHQGGFETFVPCPIDGLLYRY